MVSNWYRIGIKSSLGGIIIWYHSNAEKHDVKGIQKFYPITSDLGYMVIWVYNIYNILIIYIT